MSNKSNSNLSISEEEEIKAMLKEMSKEQPFKVFKMLIKNEIRYFLSRIRKNRK